MPKLLIIDGNSLAYHCFYAAKGSRDGLIPFLENSEIVKLRQKAEGRRQRAEEIEFLNFYLFERKRFKSPVTFENWYNL